MSSTTATDYTGIMVWPATHVLCQYVCGSPPQQPLLLGESVLELGCGCGLVGITAALSLPCRPLWVSTDKEDQVLRMCRENYNLNGLHADNDDRLWIRKLQWGSRKDILAIQQELLNHTNKATFDAIVGADIVYPDTCGVALQDLFATVRALLTHDGIFYLSFCARDGYRTPLKLLEAASHAGFQVATCVPPLEADVRRKLPLLLDAKILLLKQCPDAQKHNQELGGEECRIFPGLKAAIVRSKDASNDEEWEAPFCESDDLE